MISGRRRRPCGTRPPLARAASVRAELRAAFLDVGAGDVEFQRADAAQRVEAPRHLGVFLDRRAPDVDDRRHLQLFEERPVFLDEAVHARPLQADGVDQAAGDLDRARRRDCRGPDSGGCPSPPPRRAGSGRGVARIRRRSRTCPRRPSPGFAASVCRSGRRDSFHWFPSGRSGLPLPTKSSPP